MNKDDYLDKRIPEGAGEPDWWCFLDADQEYINKQGKDPAPFLDQTCAWRRDMNINDTFPSTSNFLKKEDLPKPAKVKIKDVDLMEFDQDGKTQRKLVLEFEGKEKKLACNKTNARTIAAMLGDETDNWIGKEITLYNDPTVAMGDQIVGGIRVQYMPPATDDLDDDIPF